MAMQEMAKHEQLFRLMTVLDQLSPDGQRRSVEYVEFMAWRTNDPREKRQLYGLRDAMNNYFADRRSSPMPATASAATTHGIDEYHP